MLAGTHAGGASTTNTRSTSTDTRCVTAGNSSTRRAAAHGLTAVAPLAVKVGVDAGVDLVRRVRPVGPGRSPAGTSGGAEVAIRVDTRIGLVHHVRLVRASRGLAGARGGAVVAVRVNTGVGLVHHVRAVRAGRLASGVATGVVAGRGTVATSAVLRSADAAGGANSAAAILASPGGAVVGALVVVDTLLMVGGTLVMRGALVTGALVMVALHGLLDLLDESSHGVVSFVVVLGKGCLR